MASRGGDGGGTRGDDGGNGVGASARRDLDVVERWFQAVITHPQGVAGGIASAQAQELIPMSRPELERVILRSRRLGAEERVQVYANAYYARLLECLGECYPMLRRALGEEIFAQFAFGYLQRYPSRSYTLNRLGESFARFLDETRPDRSENRSDEGSVEGADWPDFLIDLARLEWEIGQVFDGPGVEERPVLGHEAIAAVAPETWQHARLELAPCLRVLSFRYPVNAYYTACREAGEDDDVPVPAPAEEHVALTRRDWVVRRFELSRPQSILLGALGEGRTVGEAIERTARASDRPLDALAADLREWFRTWVASQAFFTGIELPE